MTEKTWTVVNEATGEVQEQGPQSVPRGNGQIGGTVHRGYEQPQSLSDVFRILAHGTVIDRAGDRTRYGGATDEFRAKLLRNAEGGPRSAEDGAPTDWAAHWYSLVLQEIPSSNGRSKAVPPSGVAVARQLARLVGAGREVTISNRSLADAVGRRDKAGRLRAFTETGIDVLIEYGLIEKTVTGRGRGARTTYRLIRP